MSAHDRTGIISVYVNVRSLLALLAAVACAALVVAAPAGAKTVPGSPPFRVLVMDEIPSGMFARFAKAGAVGLMLPETGPTTNRRQALAELERGAQVNALLGGVPRGPRVLAASSATGYPTARDVVIVELPPPGPPIKNDHLYRIAVIGRGFHGLLTSKTTRIPGLVSVVDVVPTVLGHANTSLSSTPSDHPLAALAGLGRQVHGEGRLKYAGLFIVTGLLILLSLLGWRAAATAVPASLLANLLLGITHVSNEVGIVALFTVVTVAATLWLGRLCRGDGGLLALILGTVALYVLVFTTRPEWAAITPLGPDQNQRFWGIGNQMETLLLAPLLLAALIARRRFGIVGFAAVAVLGLAVMVDNRLGADGGGAIAVGVAIAVLGARLLRRGLVGLAAMLGGSALTVLVLVFRGLNTPGPNHLRSAFGNGFHGFLDVAINRVPLAYKPAVAAWPMTLPLAAILVAAFVLALRASRARASRDLLVALAAGLVASLVVNDSTAYILGGGIAAVGALARFVPEVRPVRVPVLAPAPATVEAQPIAGEAGGSE